MCEGCAKPPWVGYSRTWPTQKELWNPSRRTFEEHVKRLLARAYERLARLHRRQSPSANIPEGLRD